jgi:vacuolar protein sorting-associated protein 16
LYKPFFNLALQAGNPRLASTFVPKCTNVEQGATITMYEKCGMRVKAAEEAVRLKDKEAFIKLLNAAGKGTQEGREIERLGSTVFKPAAA